MGNMKNIVVLFTTFFLAYTFAEYKLSKNITELNKQIRMEMHASMFYQTCAHHYESSSEALHGFAKYFYEQSVEEKKHADKLITYMNKRNNWDSNPLDMSNPCDVMDDKICGLLKNSMEGKDISFAIGTAFNLEKKVFKSLEDIAKNSDDVQLSHFIEHEFLDEQIQSIKELNDMKSQLSKLNGNFVGVLLLDRWLLDGKKNTEL